ncbi:ATG8-interacting protein 2-like isoform X2 [Wolffia australiana]
MSENKEEQEATSARGADWEVVSLTASAYAAAPGPDGEVDNEPSKISEIDQSPDAMIMSRHFIFPPSEHENLPLEPIYADVLAGNVEEALILETLISETADPRVEAEDPVKFEVSGFCSCPSETTHESEVAELVDSSMKLVEEAEIEDSGNPGEAWWKKQILTVYTQAKEASTFWSLCVAAAVMGLVILGQQWQQERWQIRSLRSPFGFTDEMSWWLSRANQIKEVIIGSRRYTPAIHGGASSNH